MCVGYLPDSYYLPLFNHSLLNNLPYGNGPRIFLNNILKLRKFKINNSPLNIKSLHPNFYSILSMEWLSWEYLNPCMIPGRVYKKGWWFIFRFLLFYRYLHLRLLFFLFFFLYFSFSWFLFYVFFFLLFFILFWFVFEFTWYF